MHENIDFSSCERVYHSVFLRHVLFWNKFIREYNMKLEIWICLTTSCRLEITAKQAHRLTLSSWGINIDLAWLLMYSVVNVSQCTRPQCDHGFWMFHVSWSLIDVKFCSMCALCAISCENFLYPFFSQRQWTSRPRCVWFAEECSRLTAAPWMRACIQPMFDDL